MIRILVVDDHDLLREGVVAALRAAGDFDVVGIGKDGEEAIDQAAVTRPEVILMDLSMPRVDGAEATRQIVSRDPAVRVVIFTASADRRLVSEAMAAGAVACVFKDAGLAAVLHSVRRAGSPPSLGDATTV